MANNENLIPIPGRLHSVATEGHVSGADEIYDDTQQKDQETINSELIAAVGTGGSVDSRIAAAVNVEKTRAEGAESTITTNLGNEVTRATNAEEALDGRVDTLEEAVGTGGSVDSRISSAVNAAKSEIKGNATSACDTLGEAEALISAEATRAQAAEDDRYTKSETYTKEEVHNLITTPNQEYVSVTATAQTTAVTDVLPATGAADTTYRVGNWDGTQYNDSVFSEYAWNGSAYIKLSTKSQVGEVYDISANHADTKYADLTAALGTNGENIPQSLQKGGMSIKFVQSSDNKYVQFRYMGTEVTGNHNPFLDVHNWQSSDDNVKHITVEHPNSYTEVADGSYLTTDLQTIWYKVSNSAVYRVYPNPQNPSASYAITGNEVYLIDNDKYIFMNDVLMKMSRELVNNLTSGGTEKALSAEQGKILKNLVDGSYDLAVLNSMNPTIEVGGYNVVNNVVTKNTDSSFNCCKVDVSAEKIVICSFYLESGWGVKSCFVDNNGTILSYIADNGKKNIYEVPEGSKWLYVSNYNPSSNRLIVAVPSKVLDSKVIRYNNELSVHDGMLEEYGKEIHETLSVNASTAKSVNTDFINIGSVITVSPSDNTKVYRINLGRADGTFYNTSDVYGKKTVITDEKYVYVGIYNNSNAANTFGIDVVYNEGLIAGTQRLKDNVFCKTLHSGESKTYIVKDGLTLNLMAVDDFENTLGYLDLYGHIVDSPVSIGCKTVTNNNEHDITVVPIIKSGNIELPLKDDYLRICNYNVDNDSIIYAKYGNLQTEIPLSAFVNGEQFELDVIFATDYSVVPDNDVTVDIEYKDGNTHSIINKSMQRGDIEKVVFIKEEGMNILTLSATDLTKLFFVLRRYEESPVVTELTTDIPRNPYPAVLASAVGISPENTGAQNSAAINSAISQYHNIFFDVPGIYEIGSPIFYGSYTRLEFVKGCTLKKTQAGSIIYGRPDPSEHRENVSIIGNGLVIDTMGFESMEGEYFSQFQFSYTDGLYISGIECHSTTPTKQNMLFFIARNCNDVVIYKWNIYYPKDACDFGGDCQNILIDTFETTTADDPLFFGEGWAAFITTLGRLVKNVVVRNWINHTNPWTNSTYACRLMTHSWDDWTSGRRYTAIRVGDGAEMCVYNGNLYVATENEVDSEGEPTPSTVPPTHTSGYMTYSDGYTWRFVSSGVDFYALNIEDVRFENCKSDEGICAAYQDFTFEPNEHESHIQWEINNCEIKSSATAVKGVEGDYDITLKNIVCRGDEIVQLRREQLSYPYTNKLNITLNVQNVVFSKMAGGAIFKQPYQYSEDVNPFRKINIVKSCLCAISGNLLHDKYAPDVLRIDGSYIRVNSLRSYGYVNDTTYYINDSIVDFISGSATFFQTSNEEHVVSLYCNNIEWINNNSTLTYWYLTSLASENVPSVVNVTSINLSKHYAVLDSSLNANISDEYDEFELKKAKDWVKDSIIA